MALGRYTEIARAANGDVIRAGEVTVYEAGTATLATLYADDTGTIPQANPITTDYATGAWSAVAEGGLYDVVYPDGSVVHRVPIAEAPGSDVGMQPGDVQAAAPLAWNAGTTTVSVSPGTSGQVLKTTAEGTVGWATDANTTYSVISQANIENATSTTSGLITGQRAAQAVAAHVPVAAHVDPATGTVADVVTALIAAGLMAPSA